MRSFIARSGSMVAAVAFAGAAIAAAPSVAQAQSTDRATTPAINVPCSADALAAAITTANGRTGATLNLAANCTYVIQTPATVADGLPMITGHMNLIGGQDTAIMRSTDTVALFRIFEVAAGATLGLNRIIIQNGDTAGLGGGVLNAGTLSVTQGSFSGNTGTNGGAISNSAAGTATVVSTVITRNTSTGVGGGGIINFGTLTATGVTFAKNHAPINGGGLNTQPAGTSRIIGSTFASNTAGGLGGGLSNLGTTTITGTDIRLNHGSSGGGVATGNNNITLTNSVVQDNVPDNCSPLGTVAGCVG